MNCVTVFVCQRNVINWWNAVVVFCLGFGNQDTGRIILDIGNTTLGEIDADITCFLSDDVMSVTAGVCLHLQVFTIIVVYLYTK